MLGYSCVYTPYAELTHVGDLSMRIEESTIKTHTKGKHDIYLMKRFGSYIADDPFFTEPMRSILYTGFSGGLQVFAAKRNTQSERCLLKKGRGPALPLDILIFSHDLTDSGAPRAAFDVPRARCEMRVTS